MRIYLSLIVLAAVLIAAMYFAPHMQQMATTAPADELATAAQAQVEPPIPASTDAPVQSHQLANGMQIRVIENHRAPVVVSQVWYKVGGSYEHDGITGVSHVLEHMMFKGTPTHPAGEFSEIIAANGGKENAFTAKDYTAYFQRIANDKLELCLQLEADRMRNLSLDNAEFLKEVEVVKEERRLRTEDVPTALTYERFNAVTYTNSPYRQPIIGWMVDLEAMTIDDVRNWYQAWYAPNNATLVVSGDVVASDVFRLAQKYFGPLQASALPTMKSRREARQYGTQRISVAVPATVPYLIMGYKVPALKTADNAHEAYALEVLAALLDGGNSARLHKHLVRGQQIATSAGASYDLYALYDSSFVLSGVPAHGIAVGAIEAAFKQQLDAIKQTPPTQQELDRVIAQVIASTVYEQDSSFYQAMKVGVAETVGLGWRINEDYAAQVEAVTAADVQHVAQKYFIDDALSVAVLKPLPINAQQAAAEHSSAPHVQGVR